MAAILVVLQPAEPNREATLLRLLRVQSSLQPATLRHPAISIVPKLMSR